ncbi:hypothetical protein OUZ56_029580 [Daphnia magna]|uniref:Uncharacterized protein n=1 Tax=Daphnia magna TaxID=35525 RepID=A0ABR0B787_9CRUS|nr:hypothetical protein OUZ56_029580 [Daphnia magna]
MVYDNTVFICPRKQIRLDCPLSVKNGSSKWWGTELFPITLRTAHSDSFPFNIVSVAGVPIFQSFKFAFSVTYSAALTGRIVGGKGLRFVFMLEVALAPFVQYPLSSKVSRYRNPTRLTGTTTNN